MIIDRFYDPETGEHNPLSNFSQHGFWIGANWYPTCEHWYQANKALLHDEFEEIRLAESPGQAKRLGRRCLLRSDWDVVKIPAMRIGLAAKFRDDDSEQTEFLMNTGDALLIEGNNWGDRFWGVDGTGENWLGHLLMARRAELRAEP